MKPIYIAGGSIACAIAITIVLAITLTSEPDFDAIIANKDCNAAIKLTGDDKAKATFEQEFKIDLVIVSCIFTEGNLESDSVKQQEEPAEPIKQVVLKDIVHEWPESIGDSLDNPIMLPFTLDENYMVSNFGVGGCKITINGAHKTLGWGPGAPEYYVNMTISPLEGTELCQVKGVKYIVENARENVYREEIIHKKPLIGSGDVLVGIYINTYEPDDFGFSYETLYGFVFREGYASKNTFYTNGKLPNELRYSFYPGWKFDESEKGEWLPGTRILEHSGNAPKNIELVFLDENKLKDIEGDRVSLLDSSILYSKYLEFKLIED